MKPPARVIKDSDVDYTKKPDYGRVPNYLDGVREEINREKEYINHLMEQQRQRRTQHHNVQQPQMRQLSEEERQEMVRNLKLKWNEVNREYQKTTHIVNLDTRGKIRRKEEYEQHLAQLEKSIEKLSKEVVFVMDD
jgi:23S rRNA pseudoU1915 N3-methylase RlmH